MTLVEKIVFELGAVEPWPKDAKLFQPYEVEQILLPDNANCLATQAFLKMCQLPYIVEPKPNAEAMSPTLKVPFIKVGRFVIAELEGIVQFCNGKGITLTEKLDNDEKSNMRAYMSLIHTVLEMAEVNLLFAVYRMSHLSRDNIAISETLYICWVDVETYNEVTSIRNGSVYPWPLNHIQNRNKRRQVIKKLKALGWYGKKLEDVFTEVVTCCESLKSRLGEKPFFFDHGPTELDALLFGHLFTILTTPLPRSDLANIIRNYPSLIDLVKRIEKEYFRKDEKS